MKSVTFASAYARRDARVAEEARLKACIRQKRIPGSNPGLSAGETGSKAKRANPGPPQKERFKSQKGESRSLRSFQKKVFFES